MKGLRICALSVGVLCLLNFAGLCKETLHLDYTKIKRPELETTYWVRGHNETEKPQIVIIRIDDQKNAAYANRVNEERWVLPGPFEIHFQPAALQTPKGRFLDLTRLLHLHIFSPAPLDFSALETRKTAPFRLAYDFGSAQSPLFPGFEKVDPTSPLITQGTPKAFIRQGVDSLIRDGLKGITTFERPLENGLWRVSIWSEDIGAWETLPPLYERRLRINGKTVDSVRQSHSDWITRRYLKGQVHGAKTPWAAFGERRGSLFQTVIDVQNNHFKLELAGANLQATTLTGMMIEPLDQDHFSRVQQARKKWFSQRWPFLEKPVPVQKTPRRIFTFGAETLFIALNSNTQIRAPDPIRITAYQAFDEFHRTTPNSGLLIRETRRFQKTQSREKTDLIALHVPERTAPGSYDLGPFELVVLEGSFPKVDKSIGLYLDVPPHLKDPEAINSQIWCDLDYMNRLGFTAVAPPFSDKIVQDDRRARSFGFLDILAYTPVKRHLNRVQSALRQGRLKGLYLSIADEPSNPGQAQSIQNLSDLLQNATPFAKRAGHFNHPDDFELLAHVDLALINDGFGVDLPHIQKARKEQKTLWFYNMENVRLAAGFYLWRTDVSGYLQWHGRMPSADPFDPTDGREGDVQMLYPTETLCSQDHHIGLNLIRMVQGLSDLRWLLWLDETAKTSAEAQTLRRRIKAQIPSNWLRAQAKEAPYWQKLIGQIQKLALRLHPHPSKRPGGSK